MSQRELVEASDEDSYVVVATHVSNLLNEGQVSSEGCTLAGSGGSRLPSCLHACAEKGGRFTTTSWHVRYACWQGGMPQPGPLHQLGVDDHPLIVHAP